jgi:hypothetical protein
VLAAPLTAWSHLEIQHSTVGFWLQARAVILPALEFFAVKCIQKIVVK